MRSESSRRRTSDRKPVPVVVLGTAGVLVVGTGLLAVPAGGAVAASPAGRVWLYALVLAAVVGAMGAGDPDPTTRRRSRRIWAAGVGLFTATLAVPLVLDVVNGNESALLVGLAGGFAALLAVSLGALGSLSLAERRRTGRQERDQRARRVRQLQPPARAPKPVTQRRRESAARSRAAGPPGSRRARP